MKLPSRRRSAPPELPGVTGPARLDRRTGPLLARLRPGDVAVLDHLDLDRASAEALVEARVAAVVNASSFISGRFPNLGPGVLAEAGVPMVDDVGTGVFSRLKDGSSVRVHEGSLLVGGDEVASGRRVDADELASLLHDARAGLTSQLQSFTHNTTEFLRREQELLLQGEGIPTTRTRFEGRPALVVVRGYDHREDLRRLKRFVHEQHPVLVGVDAGADALLAAGHRPDVVVVGAQGLASAGSGQDTGSTVSDKALRGAREVVLHTDRSGHAAGADRLDRLGIRYLELAASGTSEDVALLLADARGADLVVAVGTHATLDEFLDRQRAGLASTFLTRLRVGPKLVDAKSVPQLYAGRVRLWQLVLVLLAGLVALGVAVASTPGGAEWWPTISAALSDALDWIRGLFR
jgi:uncharacterized membrane-anchored protein